ncbi:hypothetical protein HON52_00650 [Candidatus Uhrbacteria bacterium]|nr:hypothetical protein [Candidatus Uhrbacteria bacterium]
MVRSFIRLFVLSAQASLHARRRSAPPTFKDRCDEMHRMIHNTTLSDEDLKEKLRKLIDDGGGSDHFHYMAMVLTDLGCKRPGLAAIASQL